MGREFVRRRLIWLYEIVGRYESALFLLVPNASSLLMDYDVKHESLVRLFEGWIRQLADSGSVGEVKRLLDLMQTASKRLSANEQKSLERLSECDRNTAQFRAWGACLELRRRPNANRRREGGVRCYLLQEPISITC